MAAAASAEEKQQVGESLSEQQKNSMCAFIYRKFEKFVEETPQYLQENPTAMTLPYASCALRGSRYIVYVRSISSLSTAMSDALRAYFECADIQVYPDVRTATAQISFPVTLGATVSYVHKQQPGSGLWQFLEQLTEPGVLFVLLLSLLVVFSAAWIFFRVPDDVMEATMRGVGGWVVSHVPFLSHTTAEAPRPVQQQQQQAPAEKCQQRTKHTHDGSVPAPRC